MERSRCCGAPSAARSSKRSTTGTAAPSRARCPGRTAGGPWARGSRRSPRRRVTSPSTGTPTGRRTGIAGYSIGEHTTLTVDETIATEDAVFTALARFVLGHDLVSQVVFRHVPPEHPLRWQLADIRAGEVGDHADWLWVRLLDVPRALTARGWFADGELVLDVDDPFLGERGRYLLTVRAGEASCVPTDRQPDLALDVRDLGSLYLGGIAPSTLVRAGHIRACRPGATALADALFRTESAPHCLHWF